MRTLIFDGLHLPRRVLSSADPLPKPGSGFFAHKYILSYGRLQTNPDSAVLWLEFLDRTDTGKEFSV